MIGAQILEIPSVYIPYKLIIRGHNLFLKYRLRVTSSTYRPFSPSNNLTQHMKVKKLFQSCRWDQCAVYSLYSKISTDPGLLYKIRHSHRFVAVVIQFHLLLYSKTQLETGVRLQVVRAFHLPSTPSQPYRFPF